MKKISFAILLCIGLLMSSCATLIPPRHPDLSREEFQGMVSGSSEKTACYESGFRGGMLFLDFIWKGSMMSLMTRVKRMMARP